MFFQKHDDVFHKTPSCFLFVIPSAMEPSRPPMHTSVPSDSSYNHRMRGLGWIYNDFFFLASFMDPTAKARMGNKFTLN